MLYFCAKIHLSIDVRVGTVTTHKGRRLTSTQRREINSSTSRTRYRTEAHWNNYLRVWV